MAPLTTVGTWFIGLELMAAGWSVDQTCLGRIPMFRKLMVKGAYGPLVLKTTVFASVAVTLSRWFSSCDRNLDVIAWPSDHLMPSFSVSLYVTWSDSTLGTEVASSGIRLPVNASTVSGLAYAR